jgi:acetyl-CoA acyltransferase
MSRAFASPGLQEAVVIEAVRTPVGRSNGALRDVHPANLGAGVLRELVRRSGIDPGMVEDVIFGCVTQVGEQASSIGRTSWLAAGLPYTTAASTVTRACGSSQAAMNFAAALIQANVVDVVIAGGVESMTRIPMGSAVTAGPGNPYSAEFREIYDLVPQGISAQLIAQKYGVSRRDMDELSVSSHQRAAAAWDSGRLAAQVVPVELPGGETFSIDEGIRRTTSYDAVSALRPAFQPDHDITAGNSSQVSDGAAAVLLTSRKKAVELGLRPRARILAQAAVGTDPVLMLEGPIPATAAVLQKAGIGLAEVDLFEVNEAFASVVLAWRKETGADLDRVNVNGGAIAIGHPLGASGARLLCHLLYELEGRGQRLGLETMCCAGGLGTATLIEVFPN